VATGRTSVCVLPVIVMAVVEMAMQVDVMVSVKVPIVERKQRVITKAVRKWIVVPRIKPVRRIPRVVVVAVVIVSISGMHPEMKECACQVNRKPRSKSVSAVDESRRDVVRRVENAASLPGIVPISRDVIAAVDRRHIVVRDPHPIGVTSGPKARTPYVTTIAILP
jgi:hypothetical protein